MKLKLLAVVAALWGAGPLRAATLVTSQTATYSPAMAGVYPAYLSQFDPNLGVLNSVSVDIFGDYDVSHLTMLRDPDFEEVTSASWDYEFLYQANLGSIPFSFVASGSGAHSFQYNCILCNFHITGSGRFDILEENLDAFTGSGKLLGQVAYVPPRPPVTLEHPDKFTFRYDDWGLLTSFKVTYDYTPFASEPPAAAVPEPATWAMMIVGFGAVGYSLRRRRPYRLQRSC